MKLFKKIDFYFAGDYLCSTNQSRTCKIARQKYIEHLQDKKHYFTGLTTLETQILKYPELLKTRFSKD